MNHTTTPQPNPTRYHHRSYEGGQFKCRRCQGWTADETGHDRTCWGITPRSAQANAYDAVKTLAHIYDQHRHVLVHDAATTVMLLGIATDATRAAGLDAHAESLEVLAQGWESWDTLLSDVRLVRDDLGRYLDDQEEARITADAQAADDRDALDAAARDALAREADLEDLLRPDPWGQARTLPIATAGEPVEARDQDGAVILPGYIVASQAEDLAGQVVRIRRDVIDGPAGPDGQEFETTVVDVIPNGGGRGYTLAAEEVLVVWTHAPLTTGFPGYRPDADAMYRPTPLQTNAWTRLPDRTEDGTEDYELGHWEQMIVAKALEEARWIVDLTNPETADAIAALARVFSIPGTTARVQVTHLDD